MDIYRIIRESKEDKKLFSDNEINKLYSFSNNNVLLNIIAKDEIENKEEKSDIAKMASIILKNKSDFWEYKYKDEENELNKELSLKLKKEFKKETKDIINSLFDRMNETAKKLEVTSGETSDNPNVVIFKIFLNEYNTKYAFTWKAFKQVKREYEKNHTLEGEDIYILKAILEKDEKIDKVVDSTVFCKSSKTLSDSTIDKIKEKIG